MDGSVAGVYLPDRRTSWSRPLILCRVQAGFPSPAEDYVEGRIDLNRDLSRHPLSTCYIRVSGDSMVGAGIMPGALLVVDRAVEAHDGHVVVALGRQAVRQAPLDGRRRANLSLVGERAVPPIEITEEMDFEVWGRVVYSISAH